MELSLRNATMADLDVVAELFRQSSLSNEGDRANLLAHPDTLDFAPDPIREQRTRVAEADDTIVGFATIRIDGSAVELEDLFVDPRWMRRGVGRALVADALASARSHGASIMDVTGNGHALVFYESAGFRRVEEVATRFGPAWRLQRATS